MGSADFQAVLADARATLAAAQAQTAPGFVSGGGAGASESPGDVAELRRQALDAAGRLEAAESWFAQNPAPAAWEAVEKARREHEQAAVRLRAGEAAAAEARERAAADSLAAKRRRFDAAAAACRHDALEKVAAADLAEIERLEAAKVKCAARVCRAVTAAMDAHGEARQLARELRIDFNATPPSSVDAKLAIGRAVYRGRAEHGLPAEVTALVPAQMHDALFLPIEPSVDERMALAARRAAAGAAAAAPAAPLRSTGPRPYLTRRDVKRTVYVAPGDLPNVLEAIKGVIVYHGDEDRVVILREREWQAMSWAEAVELIDNLAWLAEKAGGPRVNGLDDLPRHGWLKQEREAGDPDAPKAH
jgi:hypothetical protein